MNKSHKPQSSFAHSSTAVLIFALAAAAQFTAAGFLTLDIATEAYGATPGGFSPKRLALAGLAFALAAGMLAAGLAAFQKKVTFTDAGRFLAARPALSLLALSAGCAGWLALACPPYRFGGWMYYFERLRPLACAAGLVPLEFWVLARLWLNLPGQGTTGGGRDRRAWRAGLLFAAAILALALVMALTGAGWVSELSLWNVAGIPLSGLQAFAVVLLAGALVFSTRLEALANTRRGGIILAVLVFAAALAVWGLTPLVKHFFSLAPAPPVYQPFPYSDARDHDLGALSILRGTGISFHGYTDKPLYMVFLAGLHLLAGSDYNLLGWLLTAILALIPAVLFFFSRRFHGPALGLLLSLSLLLRQRNAIALAHRISSVNPRLLVTETVTLLAVVVLAALVFGWFTGRRPYLALLAGGAAGAASLVRLNPLFLFLAAGLLAVPVFRRTPRALVRHLGLYAIGFSILVVPWLLTGTDAQGRSWMLVKIQDVLEMRYPEITTGLPGGSPNPGAAASPAPAAKLAVLNAVVVELQQKIDSLPAHAVPYRLLPHRRVSYLEIAPFPQQDAAASPQQDAAALPQQDAAALHGEETGAQYSVPFTIFSHALHNLSASVLALPDSFIYDDIEHLSQRPYWQDTGEWQGDLPLAQTALLALNLALAAAGLGYSWARHRWAGMVPLALLAAYALSLGLAMASGGRYIVPVDWVVYFYWGLGVVLVLKLIRGWLMPAAAPGAAPGRQPRTPEPDERLCLRLSFAGLVIAAALVPFASLGAPLLAQAHRAQAGQPAAVEPPFQPAAGERWLTGEVLYPYKGEDGSFSFTLIHTAGAAAFSAAENEEPLEGLRSGDTAALLMRTDGVGEQPAAVFHPGSSGWEVLWEAQN